MVAVNCQRYHKALANATLADVLHGRRGAIPARREEVKQNSLASRKAANLITP